MSLSFQRLSKFCLAARWRLGRAAEKHGLKLPSEAMLAWVYR